MTTPLSFIAVALIITAYVLMAIAAYAICKQLYVEYKTKDSNMDIH